MIYWVAWALEIVVYISVDLFAMLSGYLGYGKEKYKTYRILELLSIVFLYSAIITVVFFAFKPEAISSAKDLAFSLIPALDGRYWYITCYIPLAILQPFINKGLSALSAKQHKNLVWLIIILSAICSLSNVDLFALKGGYSFIWLLVCYIIGAYIKRTDYRNKHCALLIIGSLTSVFVVKMIIFKIFGRDAGYLIGYISPLMVIAAAMALVCFKNINIKERQTQKIAVVLAARAFDVYILHCHLLIYNYLIADNFKWLINQNWLIFIIYFLLSISAIYLVCAIIGAFRDFLYERLKIKEFLYKLSITIDKYIYFSESEETN